MYFTIKIITADDQTVEFVLNATSRSAALEELSLQYPGYKRIFIGNAVASQE